MVMSRKKQGSRKARKRSSSRRRRRRSLTKRRRRPSKGWTGTGRFRAASSTMLNETTIVSLWTLNKSLKRTGVIESSDRTACWSLVAIWAAFLTGTSPDDLSTQVPVVYETLVKRFTESSVTILRHRQSRQILFKPSGFNVWFELDTSNRSASIYYGSLSREDLVTNYERGVISNGNSWAELAHRMYGNWYVLFEMLSSLDSSASNKFYRSVMIDDQINPDQISLLPGEFLVVHVPHHVFIVYCEMELQYRLIDNSYPNGVSPALTAPTIVLALQDARRVYLFTFRPYPSPNIQRKRRITTEEVESIQEMSNDETQGLMEELLTDLKLA